VVSAQVRGAGAQLMVRKAVKLRSVTH